MIADGNLHYAGITMTDEQRGKLKTLRLGLLDLHKLLLDRERAAYEKANGAVASPGQFLQIVLSNEQFEWLRQLSGLIVQMDEMLGRRSTATDADAQAVLDEVDQLLLVKEDGDDFQRRYYAAIQESPDVVIAQCRIEQLLGRG
jgi:hypothetical protein